MTRNVEIWTGKALTEVPYEVYDDEQVYDQERELIFQGPTWNFLGLASEVPEAGDYKTTFLGDIPIVVVRGADGALRGFENRCAHRGALLCLERFGNAKAFTCVYHAWSYDHDGNLIGVAFQNGVNGRGGMPDDFRREDHGLRRVKIGILAGLIFGSFVSDTQALEEYLGPEIVERIHRVLPKSPKVLG